MSALPPSLAPRRVAFAVLLACFGAGVGHVYAGRGRRGAILLALALAAAPLMWIAARLPASRGLLWGIVVLVIGQLALAVFAVLDAARVARRAPVPYVARPYNHVGLYLGLAVLSVLWFLGGMALVRGEAFEAFHVPTASMAPTIRAGDRILVDKTPLAAPARWAIVVFRSPGKPAQHFVKRVVGLPGERVRVEQGEVFVDDEALRPPSGFTPDQDVSEQVVPAGHYFVLGDTLSRSRDSRHFGAISGAAIRGEARYRLWPAARFGLLR